MDLAKTGDVDEQGDAEGEDEVRLSDENLHNQNLLPFALVLRYRRRSMVVG